MKILILSIFLLIANTAISQVTVAPTIATHYSNAIKKLPANIQKMVLSKRGDNFLGYLALLPLYKIDTLNKKDKIVYTGFTVQDIDSLTGKVIPDTAHTDENEVNILPCIARLKKDTLILIIGGPMYPRILTKLIKGKVTGSYEEYMKRDTIYRLNLSQQKTSSLSVPSTVSGFKLSTLEFKTGQTIYGEMNFNTVPYYTDNGYFKTGYIKTRLLFKVVFKALITTAPDEY